MYEGTVLKPVLKSITGWLIGRENQRLYDTLDWEQEGDRLRQPEVNYPHYYSSQNFHGIPGGYLNPVAAVTYDVMTAIASPPREVWVRQHLLNAIAGKPQTILDLGCGTGSSTLMLKQTFPSADVVGMDLSPLMLVVARHKAQRAGLDIRWQHGLAETTEWEDASVELVTASFLVHEMPPVITQRVLAECFRLLCPGGQVVILDGNQRILRHTDWLIALFREPYSKVYAAGCMEDWMKAAGFESVQTVPFGWIHQLTVGKKPLRGELRLRPTDSPKEQGVCADNKAPARQRGQSPSGT